MYNICVTMYNHLQVSSRVLTVPFHDHRTQTQDATSYGILDGPRGLRAFATGSRWGGRFFQPVDGQNPMVIPLFTQKVHM